MQARYQLRHAPMRGKDKTIIDFIHSVILSDFHSAFPFLAEKFFLLPIGIISDPGRSSQKQQKHKKI
jgi:hypothetical protein